MLCACVRACVCECVTACMDVHMGKGGMCAAGLLLLLSPICRGLQTGVGARWRSCGLINTEALLRFPIQSTLETHGSSWALLAQGRRESRWGVGGSRGGEEGEPQERHSDGHVVKENSSQKEGREKWWWRGGNVCGTARKKVDRGDRPGGISSGVQREKKKD